VKRARVARTLLVGLAGAALAGVVAASTLVPVRDCADWSCATGILEPDVALPGGALLGLATAFVVTVTRPKEAPRVHSTRYEVRRSGEDRLSFAVHE
jgi:hypothetical protein